MYVLGISGPLGHDAAACLMRDGKIIAMIEEERITRKPHSTDKYIPNLAIDYCLKIAGITLDEIDYIAYSWDVNLVNQAEKHLIPQEMHELTKNPQKHFPCKRMPKIEVIDHHYAHAASSFYFSPFDEASILVVDGVGENNATSLYIGRNNKIELLQSLPLAESLGIFYGAATVHLGFNWINAGKTMGLAPYGKPTYEFPKIRLDEKDGYHIGIKNAVGRDRIYRVWAHEFMRLNIPKQRNKKVFDCDLHRFDYGPEFDDEAANFAASIQNCLEECYFNTVKVLVEKTGIRNLCLSGGVALNCTANGKLERSGLIDELFIQPAASDAGTAIGAAAEIMVRLGYKIQPLENAYGGPGFTNDDAIRTLTRLGIRYDVSDDVAENAAKLLAQGKTIGWFQGKAEYGPRALGNRSMIADPSKPGIRDHMNLVVKLREQFRPFGPSVLEEYAHEWFEKINSSQYMLKAYQVKNDKKEIIAGAVHVDGSSRPQTVTEKTNAVYYRMLNKFYKEKSIPMVLNTSFNLRGEPMVLTPYDAIRTFFTSALDLLVINDLIVYK